MTPTRHYTEILCALHWYFDSKNLALKNALQFRCPLSVEQQRELRQYYSEYFASLVSATELLLELEYEHCAKFKTALESVFVFDSLPDGESNYAYIRELRNSIIHRGLDVSAATHVNNDFLMLVAPSPVSNRKRNKKYQPMSFYLLDVIAKCEAVIGPLIARHLDEVGLLKPEFTQDQAVENARVFMAECSSIPEWVKASAHEAIATVDHIEVQMAAIKSLVVRSNNNITDLAIIAMILMRLLTEVIMAGKTKRAALLLTEDQKTMLKELSRSRKAPAREVERAKVLIGYADGISITGLQRQTGCSRPMIYKCIDKALAAGVQMGLKDAYHRPREPEISDEARAWVASIACTKPKENGLAAELWSISGLAHFVSERAESAGFPRLAHAGKSTVWRILDENEIKPHKIRYYLEKRDPDFDRKMQEVLLVYREVSIYAEGAVYDKNSEPVYTVSVDEKPGVQAIGLTAPDLPPVPGQYASIGRDYEYVRHGTVSILAGIDLHSGHIFANVEDRHRSVEFIALLKRIDEYYPSEATIRVVLDNHSAHISKETLAYLATRPGRFEYVHTPKHGSWLNLIECAFSKMARTFLRHIRVNSIDELKTRILKGIDEINASPVIFRWNKFDLGVA